MEDTLISVILPIYNVEKFLENCIESIINQTYKNLEIILVNDGSTDESGKICDKFKKKDKRIKVIHKRNGGLSDARNAGMKISKGKYITFVDSDDLVHKQYIETLWNLIVNNKADISMCDYKSVNENFSYDEKADENLDSSIYVLDRLECIKKMYIEGKHGLEFLAWGKLYRKSLFTKNNIKYPKGKIHEDTFTTYKLIYYSEKIVFKDECLYFYRIRTGSIMNSIFNLKKLDKLEAIEQTCEFFTINKEKELLSLAFNDYMKNCIKLFHDIKVKYEKEDQEEIAKSVIQKGRDMYNKYIKLCNYPINKRVFYRIILYDFPFKLKKCIIKSFLTKERGINK